MKYQFWQDNGEPKILKPYIVESDVKEQKGMMRKSWIKIEYEKDKVIKKFDKVWLDLLFTISLLYI